MIKAYSKINIFLEIIGKNGGFHALHSLFVKINLHDEISVIQSESFQSTYCGAVVENDILLKTKNILQKHFPTINTNFAFEITKKIPIGGGLGGASSDAAEVMKFLLMQNNIFLTQNELFEIGSEIGADVPFFLCNGPMFLHGVGKELWQPNFSIPNLWFVLHIPKYSSITKDVFAKIQPPYTQYAPAKSFDDCISKGNDMFLTANELSKNVIQASIAKLSQDANAVKVQMSGSGSVCFAMFLEERHAEKYQNMKDFIICKTI
jgi:4-diphosphocytidyl-2-C-methyl-D-erythritol kinase